MASRSTSRERYSFANLSEPLELPDLIAVHTQWEQSLRRAVAVTATPRGAEIVDRLYPEHAGRVAATFAALDDAEKRQLAVICSKLAA